MTPSPALSAPDGSGQDGDGPVLAGLGLGMVDERHADGVAAACVEQVVAGGGEDVFAATCPVVLGGRRGVAVLLEVRGLPEPDLEAALLAATAVDRVGSTGWAVLVGERVTGDPVHAEAVRPVISAGARRDHGRAVVFPGQAEHAAETTVGALLATTAIDRVEVLGGVRPDPATTLLTRGHLRPRWVAGDLVLHVQPARNGVLVPFETPDPTPCCAAHA